MRRLIPVLFAIVLLTVSVASASADDGVHARAVRWFRQPHLGVFIHYGPASLIDTTESGPWYYTVRSPAFPPIAAAFRANPAAVTQWVALAKQAGASYIVFTAKHHDGFTLWPTATETTDRLPGAGPWSVPASSDIVSALARACRRAGIKLFVYYSLIDWWSAPYASDDDATYLRFMKTQLTELLTRYGQIGGVWLDGVWDKPMGWWHLDQIAALIHRLQPAALVGVNHASVGNGRDFEIYEETQPKAPTAVPSEVTFPIGAWWFYGTRDTLKSPDAVRGLIAQARAQQANFLIDVPPRPDGRIDLGYAYTLLAATR